MAAFTFAAGNARGLRRLPLFVLGAVATKVVPRTPALWVFGSGIGPGEGALPLLLAARAHFDTHPRPDPTRLVWLSSTAEHARRAGELGLETVDKMSARGLWLTMRAQVAVVTHGLGDVNRFGVRGAFVVQLWHGIPLKRLHLDAPVAMSAKGRLGRFMIGFGYRAVGRQIDLFPVASERVRPRIESAFAVTPDRVAVTGDPRDDVLLAGPERREVARALLADRVGVLPDGPVVMYAPTWRDGDPDPAAPDDATWDAIAAWLDRVDGIFVVRSHPLGRGDYDAGPACSPRIRIMDAARQPDLTPVLSAVDHLVTDYSSTAFDFSLTGGTIVFLAADVNTYVGSRGFYETYSSFTGGRHVATWQHALPLLDELVAGSGREYERARAHTRWLRDEHFDRLDGRATERVLAEVLCRVDGGPACAATEATAAEATATAAAATADAQSPRPAVTAARIDNRCLRLTLAAPGDVAGVQLVGARTSLDGVLTPVDDDLVAEFALTVSRWSQDGLALPSGDYRLVLTPRAGLPTTRVDVAAPALDMLDALCRATVRADAGGLVLQISAPLAPGERGRRNQQRLRARSMLPGPLDNAVYFESFYGRTASDNPLGIERVLARRRPDVTRYWSVADRSVPVPDGAVPLVEYTAQWWRVRAAARVYVVNDWLRWTHRRRRGQRVLQTWHGTMLKHLALDRPNRNPRRNFAVVRQSLRWNAMLAQNDYSAVRFRSSYAFRGPMWTTGYPRNDVFADPARVAPVRAVVGLAPGQRAVLYAPTWRDDRDDLVDHLDLAGFAEALPADCVLLVRGHSRTLGHGGDVRGRRLIDVTTYPDAADLMLVADVLVTDYSSVMFDFAATGKPMVFFTPDIDHYADNLRGFYFDLLAEAPGPVVATTPALTAAVREALVDGVSAEHRTRYSAWRAKFTPWDDGQAGERVVDRMLAEGWLD